MKQHRPTVIALAAVAAIVGTAYYMRPPPLDPPAVVLNAPSLVPPVMNAFTPRAAQSAPVVAPPATGAQPTAALHAKAAEYARLTAEGATPAMLSAAFEFVLSCQREAEALSVGVQTHPLSAQRCQLPPGEPQAATLKRMLEARVERADFGTYVHVARERTGAYADDPEGWRALVKKARTTGIAKGEPVVLGGEAITQLGRGEVLQSMGLIEEAQAAYRLALSYQVAHDIGLAKANKQPPPASLFTPKVLAISARITSPTARESAIEQGRKLALTWGNQS